MAEVNDLIIEKLKQYPTDVQSLAVAAIRLSETLPVGSVAEQLESEIRKIIRQGARSNDT